MQNKINRYVNKSFLLIDDFIEFRHSVKNMVEAIGASQIDQASSGQEGIELYSRQWHDFILLDFNLGEGLNGLQLLGELHSKDILRHDTVIILITAETSLDMVTDAIEIRPDEFLAKPFSKIILKKRLDKAFEKKDAIKPVYECLNNKQYLKAILQCDKLIKQNTKYSLACQRIKADCFLRIGKPQNAQAVYEQLLAYRQVNWALLGYARCKVHRSQYHEAIADFDKIIEVNRYSLEAYDQKAESLLAIGEYEDAYSVLKQAISISPNSAYRQRNIANLAIRYHDYEIALTALRKVIVLTRELSQKQPEDYLKLAQILSVVHGSNMGQLSRRAPAELARLLKVLHSEFQSDIQLGICTIIHQGIYEIMSGHTNNGERKIHQAQQRIDDLPDELKPFLCDEIEFANKLFSDHPSVNELYQHLQSIKLHTPISEDVDKAHSFNRQGMVKFRDKDFETAFLAFKTAYLNARDNVNITLNLMQVMLKLINQNEIKSEFSELLEMFTQTYKRLDVADQRCTHFKLLFKNINSQLVSKQPKGQPHG
jgi:tetratricopeptide (TPR) repeat protein